jgi:uncharacterized membrane protein YdjX (TVP38/TMEM64 family)
MTNTFTRKQLTLELFVHFTLTALTLVTLFMLLPTIQPVFKLIGIAFALIIVGFDVFFFVKRNIESLKITRLLVIYFFAVILIVFAVFYLTKLLVLTDMYGFENLLKQNESTAKFIYMAICFAQPIILPIPEVVTITGASAAFGPVTAILLGFLGTLAGIVVMYLIARFGGQPILSKFVKETHLIKYQTYVQKNETFFLVIMFITPVLPDEIICIGAGLGAVSFRRFLILAALSKLFTASIFAYSVELAKLFSLSTTQLIVCLSIAAGVVFLLTTVIKRKKAEQKEKA